MRKSLLTSLLVTLACVLPAVSQAATKTTKVAGGEAQVITLLNQIRAQHNLPLFTANAQLRTAARAHSTNMLQKSYFDHNGPDGTWDTRIARYLNSTLVGENIAWGQGAYGTPAGIVDQWMHSPTHRAIILTPGLKRVGIGLVQGSFQGADAAVMATADFAA